jgi:Carbohydrate-selective porin, OprB family/S-layer homology domain
MSNILWKSLVVSPAVLGATLLVSATAMAAPNTTTQVSPADKQAAVLDQVNRYSKEGSNSQAQVTSVSQFSDVQPTDWAFQALQSLVERYGCIAGYPSGVYRGNRALTRYEFAAGLNACLDRVNELIATATADLVTKQDLATLQRLQEEFSAELATLRGRVDSLEARTAELEAHQFSTTTKLVGEAIFAVSSAFGDRTGDANNVVFQDRVRLGLETSFTGRDKLTTRLAAGNASAFSLRDAAGNPVSSAEGTQTYQVGSTGNNAVRIDRLTYEVPVGPAQVYIAAAGGRHSHYAAVNNPYFFDKTDGGNGALSTFASESPIYRVGGGAGIALNIPFSSGGSILKPSSFTLGYLASDANNPGNNTGLFNGNYAALGQLNFAVGDRLALAATYVHGYHSANSSLFDAGITNSGDLPIGGVVGTRQANAISAAFRPSDKLSVSGFITYHDVNQAGAGNDFEAWSYGGGVSLPDFGKKGNVLGIFAGAEPYARGRTGFTGATLPIHVEGFYKYRVSDNISVTPGVIWLRATGQNDAEESSFIGTLRTTFTF